MSVLELHNITKSYPGVKALKGVSLSFEKGEVHAIVGENGAGKSTLIKTIAGAIEPDGGEIVVDGQSFERLSPRHAKDLGIEVIYQEFNLVESLSAAENIFLGEKRGRLVPFKYFEARAKETFDKFGVPIDPRTPVGELTPAQMQIVEICKAISRDLKVLVMDEPTAPLTVSEVEAMFRIVADLKARGVTIIYISHRIDEIFAICDRVSVLRDGEHVATTQVSGTTRQALISLMVGRELKDAYIRPPVVQDEVALKVCNMTGNGVRDVSFDLKRGEILGISGLVGAGRTELVRLIFGADPRESGTVIKDGKEIHISSVGDAMRNGIGLIPEDRKQHGVFLDMSVGWNISIPVIRRLSRYLVVSTRRETDLTEEYRSRLRIKTPSLDQLVRNLSGGNQQKVVLAKVLASESDVIIFDEPTRGIDVGAREEIYGLMAELVGAGKSILMISSDMEELLGMCDRILVICEGRLTGELSRAEFRQDTILELASAG